MLAELGGRWLARADRDGKEGNGKFNSIYCYVYGGGGGSRVTRKRVQ